MTSCIVAIFTPPRYCFFFFFFIFCFFFPSPINAFANFAFFSFSRLTSLKLSGLATFPLDRATFLAAAASLTAAIFSAIFFLLPALFLFRFFLLFSLCCWLFSSLVLD
uniref:Uncharacterized protein n=1 Tax=Cacopsylla melanoneura TaxID=428564 RepID=A0A8D9A8Y1_9HEMI